MHSFRFTLGVAILIGLAACGSGGGGGGGGGGSDTSSFTYTMTAALSEFAVGRHVVVVDQASTNDASCNSATSGIVHSRVQVTSAGSAAVHVSLPTSSFKNYYLETIYVDVDSSNNLNNGDLVMGTSTTAFSAFCNLMGTDNKNFTFDWDDLQAVAFSGGPSTWAGGSMTFSAGAGEDEEIKTLTTATVGGNLSSFAASDEGDE